MRTRQPYPGTSKWLDSDGVIGAVAHSLLLDALVESGHGHESHDRSSVNGVLNACRGWRHATEGVWSSKTAAGRWALLLGCWDRATITAALELRENGRHARDVR